MLDTQCLITIETDPQYPTEDLAQNTHTKKERKTSL